MNIFVGNLAHEVNESDLMSFFTAYGHVASVVLYGDPFPSASAPGQRSLTSDRLSRGYAYVEMPDQDEAGAALSGADGKLIRGLPFTALEAMPLEKKRTKETQHSRSPLSPSPFFAPRPDNTAPRVGESGQDVSF